MILAFCSWLVAAQVATAGPQATVSAVSADRVEIVLFTDFQCPFCARFAKSLRELQANGLDGIEATVRFKHFPLVIHSKARLAHQAALAAGEQGKFWDMHDLLFANQRRAERDDVLGYARTLRLDMVRFQQDLDSDAVKQIIDADIAEGNASNVNATPTYVINGKAFTGTRSLDQLKQLVGGEQRRARALAEITDDMVSRGAADAPVTIELWADLQSPISGPAFGVLNDALTRYRSAVRLRFRNFPLAFHPQSALAHEAAMTAAREGRFWEFVTYVLDHQDSVREQDLIALAGRLDLDEARFADALQQHRYAPRVDVDLQAGLGRGLRGSPVILVNGRRIDGVPNLQTLIEHIEAALGARQ